VLEGASNGQELTYLQNSAGEPILSALIDHNQTTWWQLVGYKGTGKSTTIKGFFGLWDADSITKFHEESLVLYCSFNSTDLHTDDPDEKPHNAVRRVIEGVLGAALRRLKQEREARRDQEPTAASFHAFVVRTKPDILSRYEEDDSIDDTILRELKAWECGSRITYLATKLKFELSQLPLLTDGIAAASPFLQRQLVVIIDDVEGIPKKEGRKALAHLLSPLWNCFRNGVSYPTKFLLATRPHTRDEFSRNQVWTPITVDFANTLTLQKLLEHKAERFLEHTPAGRELLARPTAAESLRVLWALLARYGSNENHEVILGLSNSCFRDSLSLLTNLLQHAPTDKAELGETAGGGFALTTKGNWPVIPRANLLELIGKRGYDDFAPDEAIGLINLFENDPDDESTDFLIILLLHWAWHHSRRYASHWPRLIDVHVFKENVSRCLPGRPILRKLDWAERRCEQMGLLDDVLDRDDPERELHHLMPRADLLYQELSQSSILLALSYQDVYMEEGVLSNFKSDRREPFLFAIRLCRHLLLYEQSLFDACVDKRLFWERIYHKRLLAKITHVGLEKTWSRWSGHKPQDAYAELNALGKDIARLESKYGN
jgi:hypothetical protein